MTQVKVFCEVYRCDEEAGEHIYCDSHYDDKIDEAYERGKKDGHAEGHDEAKAEFQNKE